VYACDWQAVINSIGGIRTLFLLLEQAVSRRVGLHGSDVNVPSELDLQFASQTRMYYFCWL